MIRISKSSVYNTFANKVVEFLKQDLKEKFPIKGKTKTDVVAFSVAPPSSPRSNFWTTGSLHRDGGMEDNDPFYLSVMVFMDDVTELNGSIKFYQNSVESPINKKNPMRTTSLLKSFSVTGKKGTILVWDTRKLHIGNPNKSKEYRTVMVFAVHSNNISLSQSQYLTFEHEI